MNLLLIFLAVILFIVIATTKFGLHPFLTLLSASFITAFAFGLPMVEVVQVINAGFGGILSYIGLVIVFGTIIGVILEKTGAAVTMANTIIKLLGKRYPTLTMSVIGYIVSIPVFCDSGFVILNSLKKSLSQRMQVSSVAMSIALATGLYATHTFVPPTPGPIAAAANLKLGDQLGLVIAVGLFVSIPTILAGLFWANRFRNFHLDDQEIESGRLRTVDQKSMKLTEQDLPSPLSAFIPIIAPILMICIGSIANFPSRPFGTDFIFICVLFLGKPLIALIIGLALSTRLIKLGKRTKQLSNFVSQGITAAAPIILITGAGGAFGAVLKVTPMGDYIGQTLSGMGVGIFMPFLVAAALKSTQGSSTVALVTTSAMVANLLPELGLDSSIGRVLTVMAIGAGAMTVSHANDSYFWVVSQFSNMNVSLSYRAHTMATLFQGLTGITIVFLLSLLLL
jgi:GntP family gluconate:H+ symporter